MTVPPDQPSPPSAGQAAPSFGQATRVWAEVGLNSFGGPAGQIAVMHREVVDRRGWLDERRFLHALNYCMVLPGPEAQQLATYIGWLLHGVRGGVVAGVLFILPGFVVMMILAALYAVYGQVSWVAGLLFGIQAAVVAIVVQALVRIGTRTLHSPFLVVLAAAAFVALALLGVAFPVVIVAAGALGWLAGRLRPHWLPGPAHEDSATTQPSAAATEGASVTASRSAFRAAGVCLLLWLVPVIAVTLLLGSDSVFTQQAWLFSKTAVISFGGAYAVLSYITVEAVDRYGWLTTDQMATGLGLAESTPGPLILVVQFVGFLAAYSNPGSLPPLVAGILGATVAVWVTFVPCFLFIFAGAPYVERLRHNTALRHCLTAIAAAIVGVIANLALWFAETTLFAAVSTGSAGPVTWSLPIAATVVWPAVAIAAISAVLLFGMRWSTLRVVAVGAALGVAVTLVGWR